MFSLTGKHVLITGAAGSIGSATARLCGSLGARLALHDCREPTELALALARNSIPASVHASDLRDRESIEALVAELRDIDVVVANAGLCPFDDWNDVGWDETFRQVMEVNVLGTFHLVRAIMKQMTRSRKGRIVIVSSVAARNGGVISGPHYVASKGALSSFIKWAALKMAPAGVLVNGVAPGPTRTNMTANCVYNDSSIPLGRIATPEEIAGPIAFLCSPAASYLCGAIIDVNGGIYMS